MNSGTLHSLLGRGRRAVGLCFLVAGLLTAMPSFAAVRAYLPDVRGRWAGFTSEISIRNNGASSANVIVDFRLPNGDLRSRISFDLAVNASTTFVPPGAFSGSGIIDANQDVSVSLVHQFDTANTIDGYAGVRSGRRQVFVPIVHKSNSNWFSDLFIQNVSSASATATAVFQSGRGGAPISLSVPLAPRGRVQLSMANLSQIPTGFVGSVTVSSDQNVAVASTQFLGDRQLMATSSSQDPALTLYAPLVQNDNSGYLSGVQILNTTRSSSFADLLYYRGSGGAHCTETFVQKIEGGAPWTGYPAPPKGNACKSSDGTGDVLSATFRGSSALAANVNQLFGSTQATTYAAISRPSRIVSIPRLRRDERSWNDGFVIQNATGGNITASVTFYDRAGRFAGSVSSVSIKANGFRVVFGELPNPFDGSAVVTASGNVAVAVNNLKKGSGDVIASYPGDHR